MAASSGILPLFGFSSPLGDYWRHSLFESEYSQENRPGQVTCPAQIENGIHSHAFAEAVPPEPVADAPEIKNRLVFRKQISRFAAKLFIAARSSLAKPCIFLRAFLARCRGGGPPAPPLDQFFSALLISSPCAASFRQKSVITSFKESRSFSIASLRFS